MNERDVKAPTKKVYDYIHSEITNRRMKPGQGLTESSLCKTLGVGRSPVRLALQQLSKDGFILLRENRGAAVQEFTETEVRQLYALREHFIAYALDESIDAYTEKDFRVMEDCLATQEQAFLAHAFDDYIAAVAHFYRFLIEKAENPYLTECATVIVNRTNVYLCLYDDFYSVKKLKSLPLMREMVNGIREGNASKVIRAHRKLRRNIVNSYDWFVSHPNVTSAN